MQNLIFLIILVLTCPVLSAKDIKFKTLQGRNFIAIIDAGSSGTRLFVFEYKPSAAVEQNLVVEIVSYNIDPGISNFVNNLGALNLYFTKLINGVKNKLLKYNKKLSLDTVPLYFLATAGMRNISQHDQNIILAKASTILEKSGLNLQKAHVISGLQEGVYAWVAANFNRPTKNILGLIEIGGASAQVVFPFDGDNPHAVIVSLDDKSYNLYAYSYPNKGENESIKQVKELDNNKYNSFCTTREKTQRKRSTFYRCLNLIIEAFKSDCDNKQECQNGWTNEAVQPSIEENTHFTFEGAIRGPKNIIKKPLDQNTLKEAGLFACQMTTQDLITLRNINPKYANKACFQSALTYVMLYGNAGIKNTQRLYTGIGLPGQISLIQLPAPGPEWTVGYILFHEEHGQIKYLNTHGF